MQQLSYDSKFQKEQSEEQTDTKRNQFTQGAKEQLGREGKGNMETQVPRGLTLQGGLELLL